MGGGGVSGGEGAGQSLNNLQAALRGSNRTCTEPSAFPGGGAKVWRTIMVVVVVVTKNQSHLDAADGDATRVECTCACTDSAHLCYESQGLLGACTTGSASGFSDCVCVYVCLLKPLMAMCSSSSSKRPCYAILANGQIRTPPHMDTYTVHTPVAKKVTPQSLVKKKIHAGRWLPSDLAHKWDTADGRLHRCVLQLPLLTPAGDESSPRRCDNAALAPTGVPSCTSGGGVAEKPYAKV